MNQDQTTSIDNKSLMTLAKCLQEVGLNVLSPLPVQSLVQGIWVGSPVAEHGTILLLGNGGQGFWQKFRENRPAGEHPVDDYSASLSERLLQQYFPAVARERLFPSEDCPVALQRLMAQAGWHAPSPLGIGMHPEFGLWSACRAVWWLGAELVADYPVAEPKDHCLRCVERPCLAACPGDALSAGQMPLLERCADYRLREVSKCADTCLARKACPVASEHRYSDEQLHYHYELARSAISRYRSVHSTSGGD
ncbi:MAG: hypothetical protein ACPGSC_00985 [Granulosicoccaceae bacterium]